MAKSITREEIIAELQKQAAIKEGKSDTEFTMLELVAEVFPGLNDPTVRRIMKKLLASGKWQVEERVVDGRRRMVYWKV